MPLLAGRYFSARDSLHAPKVMIVNDTMAQEYWPGQVPLGKQVTLGGLEDGVTMKVVGVVRSSKKRSIMEKKKPIGYWPLAQDPRFTCTLLIRTYQDPYDLIPTLTQEVAALKPDKICHIRTVADHVTGLLFPQHAITIILNLFGFTGILLCGIGLYSVIAYTVKQRTQEIGIRMALGAERRHIVESVLFKGSVLILTGLVLGLGLSLIAVRLLEKQLVGLREWNRFVLFGVDIWEPKTFLTVILFVLVIALLACWIPARRAARIDPMEALRYE
jgi:putative ABC transport system permease protein